MCLQAPCYDVVKHTKYLCKIGSYHHTELLSKFDDMFDKMKDDPRFTDGLYKKESENMMQMYKALNMIKDQYLNNLHLHSKSTRELIVEYLKISIDTLHDIIDEIGIEAWYISRGGDAWYEQFADRETMLDVGKRMEKEYNFDFTDIF